MKKRFLAILALVTAAMFSTSAQAAIVLSVEVDPPVSPGDTAEVSIFATSDAADDLTGFALPIEIGGDGFIGLGTNMDPNPNPLPFPLSFNANPIANLIDPGIDPNFAGFQNNLEDTDVIVNLGGAAPIALSTTPTKLFDLVLDVDPAAGPGSFPVSIVDDGIFFQVTSSGGVATASAPASGSGSVNITAVPEPSSMLALSALAVSGAAYRRRKKAAKS